MLGAAGRKGQQFFRVARQRKRPGGGDGIRLAPADFLNHDMAQRRARHHAQRTQPRRGVGQTRAGDMDAHPGLNQARHSVDKSVLKSVLHG
jgi:hypothetical protein